MPEKLYKYLLSNKITKREAAEHIISLIENNDDVDIRIKCIEAFEKIDLRSEEIFKTLENSLISDENPLVRASAAQLMIKFFLKKSEVPLKWAVQQDKSPIVFVTIYELLKKHENIYIENLKKEIVKKLENYVRKYINCGLKSQEAQVLGLLEILNGTKLNRRSDDERLWDGCEYDSVYKMNDTGNVVLIEIKDIHGMREKYPIAMIPEQIGSLKSLETLLILENKIKSIPESIGSLHSLKNLNLNWNLINTLPKSIGSLISLKILELRNNQLEAMPEEVGLLKSLEKLDLSKNQIQALIKAIGSLNSIKQIDLSHNNIQSIPESVKFLTSLEHLDLSYNNINSIPDSIGSLISLENLNLSYNKINTIPNSIGSLISLEIFPIQLEILIL
jgi:Leucine-rich repeat (LRR) protein